MVGPAIPLKCFVPWKDFGFRAWQGKESASINGWQEDPEFIQFRASTFARLNMNHKTSQKKIANTTRIQITTTISMTLIEVACLFVVDIWSDGCSSFAGTLRGG